MLGCPFLPIPLLTKFLTISIYLSIHLPPLDCCHLSTITDRHGRRAEENGSNSSSSSNSMLNQWTDNSSSNNRWQFKVSPSSSWTPTVLNVCQEIPPGCSTVRKLNWMTLLLSFMWRTFRPFPSIWRNFTSHGLWNRVIRQIQRNPLKLF